MTQPTHKIVPIEPTDEMLEAKLEEANKRYEIDTALYRDDIKQLEADKVRLIGALTSLLEGTPIDEYNRDDDGLYGVTARMPDGRDRKVMDNQLHGIKALLVEMKSKP
jgi:hypothetical protein